MRAHFSTHTLNHDVNVVPGSAQLEVKNSSRRSAGPSRKWLMDSRLDDYRESPGTAPALALNSARSDEATKWVEKRDELLATWSKNKLLDLEESWSVAAKAADKVTMVISTHLCFSLLLYYLEYSRSLCRPWRPTRHLGGAPWSSTPRWRLSP